MCKGAFPLDKAGTIALPQLPPRKLVTGYLEHLKITDELLVEHFTQMFQTFVSSLASKDFSKMDKIVEKNFLNKLLQNKDSLNKFDL